MNVLTLVYAALVVQVCSGACLLLISRQIPGLSGLHWYGWAYLLMAGGFGLGSLGHDQPGLYSIAGRVVVLAGVILLTQGVSDFVVRGADALAWGWMFLLAFGLVELGLWKAGPHPLVAVSLGCAVLAVQFGLAAVILLSNLAPVERRAARASALLIAATIVVLAMRAIAVPLHLEPLDLFVDQPLRLGVITGYIVLTVALAFGFVWMAIARLRSQLEVQARTDALTGVLNRRALTTAGESEIAACRERRVPLSLLAIDLDHFKMLNDRHGHAGGDRVLVAAAQLLCQGLRKTDLVARLGGEEFAVVLPDRDSRRGLEIAERLRARFESLEVSFEGQPLSIRASFGVATLAEGESWSELLRRADLALYRAKGGGRNRTCVAAARESPLEAPPEPPQDGRTAAANP